MDIPFFDLARQHAAYAEKVENSILEVAGSGSYILGPHTAHLEKSVASYLGVAHGAGVASGTDALHLAIAALNIGAGDEIITTPFTFAATIEAIQYVGAKAVLVDIDPDTYNIDAALIENAITPKTRGIIAVHMFGLPADMQSIMAVAEKHELKVIEDCAQSFGARIGDKLAGTFGDAAALSFYPTKTLGGYGDGGMVCLNDGEAYRRLCELRNHGIATNGEHVLLGFNSRLDEIQSAALQIKLEHLDAMNERRREIAAYYNEKFSAAGAVVPIAPDGMYHVYGYYTLLVDDRDALRNQLRNAGIATAIYYPKPLHMHEHFSKTCRYASLEVAESVSSQCVSLPIFPDLTQDEIEYIGSTAARFLG